ncbi:DMT family transporter [Propionivibrio sp.]|uniref:DMT family transporter n=1 Tax=Propionivibrio sp. TaxID=2212460 RepID=UPI0026223A0C|nr:DMT family transporter [Propionivibrio sp.]
MAESQASRASRRETRAAVFSLLVGALVWGLIWYPYRILRDAGVDGVLASTVTYAVAFVLGLWFFRRSLAAFSLSWGLLWLGLASAGCNLGYVLATLNGEVVRVLLLFYLAPLWTVLLSRLLLGERLNRFGIFVIALSLAGAATMLWQPRIGLPVPRDVADWFGLGAGFSFALLNVLSRQARGVSIEIKAMVAFAGVVLVGGVLLLSGIGDPQIPAAPSAWLLIAMIGGVLVVVNLFVQYGLARIAANRAIVIMLSEVGFAALSSWLLADEAPGLREWVGGAMIVAASVFSARMEIDG